MWSTLGIWLDEEKRNGQYGDFENKSRKVFSKPKNDGQMVNLSNGIVKNVYLSLDLQCKSTGY